MQQRSKNSSNQELLVLEQGVSNITESRGCTLWHSRFQPVSVQFRKILKSLAHILTSVLPMQCQCFGTNQELFTVVPWEKWDLLGLPGCQ